MSENPPKLTRKMAALITDENGGARLAQMHESGQSKKKKANDASQRYRACNSDAVREAARLRMAKKRANMSGEQKMLEKERRKVSNREYYLKNRDRILENARQQTEDRFEEKYGDCEYWKNFWPRVKSYSVGVMGNKDRRRCDS
ncbi:hypothetical protein V5O48_012204 [Marasmius crinis-equi]|uniref:BZIP domain-containing protein n=1 Tax=Marasmius crinis-equi TaxID=585013 RepID=A0ABR3F3I4_9AGAR